MRYADETEEVIRAGDVFYFPKGHTMIIDKIHLLVDQRGAPLAIEITGANQHDKWSVASLLGNASSSVLHTPSQWCLYLRYNRRHVVRGDPH